MTTTSPSTIDALDGLHVVELGEPVLDGLRHQPLEVDRVDAGHDDRVIIEAGDLEVRVFLARHVQEGEDAERDQAQEGDQRRLVAADRVLEQRHGRNAAAQGPLTTSMRSPS